MYLLTLSRLFTFTHSVTQSIQKYSLKTYSDSSDYKIHFSADSEFIQIIQC